MIFMRFLAFILLLIFLLYIIDLSDIITILDFHETVPFLQFGILWTILGFILLSPLISKELSNRDDADD